MVELHTLSDPALAESLSQLEAAASAHAWQAVHYRQSLVSGQESVWLLQRDGQWLAVLVCEQILDELHIHNIFVPVAAQRQGFARQLLTEVMGRARDAACVRCLLEVRCSNVAAIALYQSLGFVQGGIRKAYYPLAQGREDALLMECPL